MQKTMSVLVSSWLNLPSASSLRVVTFRIASDQRPVVQSQGQRDKSGGMEMEQLLPISH